MPQMHKYPTSFQATDCVIIHREAGKLLLGKKKIQTGWRFLGGFVDPKDDSLELANARERQEEAGLDSLYSR
jgi:bifunctional NMN adenylyltransferase/nudix hydrolase